MPTTRDRCLTSGEYFSQCGCVTRLEMNRGMFFPRCYQCDKRVVWEMTPSDPPQVELSVPQDSHPSSPLEQLEVEMLLVLADQSLPMATRNELESRLASIRQKAGAEKPQ